MKPIHPPEKRHRLPRPEAMAQVTTLTCPKCGESHTLTTYRSDEQLMAMSSRARWSLLRAHGHDCPHGPSKEGGYAW